MDMMQGDLTKRVEATLNHWSGDAFASSFKSATTHYVWRTRGDDVVRPEHAENDGRVFSWDNPPPTKHPGEDHGCRCSAEPYVLSAREHLDVVIDGVADNGASWTSARFVDHYFNGAGRPVRLRDTGHLESVVDEYWKVVSTRIKIQIAQSARKYAHGDFFDTFERSYQMQHVVFSLGNTTIGGDFVGRAILGGGRIVLYGDINFRLKDFFEDPLDVGVEVVDPLRTIYDNLHAPLDDYARGRPTRSKPGLRSGLPYAIEDEWRGRFEGWISADDDLSVLR